VTNPLLTIRGIRKRFGAPEVLRGSRGGCRGEFPHRSWRKSGSGKRRCFADRRFEQADSGEILMLGERIDELPPYKRPVNTVFPTIRALPAHERERECSLWIACDRRRVDEAPRADQALAQVKMTELFVVRRAERRPQQRVALHAR